MNNRDLPDGHRPEDFNKIGTNLDSIEEFAKQNNMTFKEARWYLNNSRMQEECGGKLVGLMPIKTNSSKSFLKRRKKTQ